MRTTAGEAFVKGEEHLLCIDTSLYTASGESLRYRPSQVSCGVVREDLCERPSIYSSDGTCVVHRRRCSQKSAAASWLRPFDFPAQPQ